MTDRAGEMQIQRGQLSDAGFQILLTLSQADLHGYAIMRELATAGVRMGPGTLYSNIKRLIEQRWIEEVRCAGSDPRRRTYRLTDSGRATLRSEATRLAALVERATAAGALPAADDSRSSA